MRGASALLLLAAGCERTATPTFELESFLVEANVPIPLNRPLIWQFRGGLIDPASVHGGGIVIEELNPAGAVVRQAEGRFEVSPDNRVVFLPRLGSRADFSDCGLRPGRKYRVLVEGFPRATGIRSTLGQPLARRSIDYFLTAAGGRELFEDQTATQSASVTTDHLVEWGVQGLAEVHVDSGSKLVLHVGKPLRPDTVVASHFAVRMGVRGEQRLPVEVKLINDESSARIELELKTSVEPGASALVEIDPAVTDLGGGLCQGPLASRFLWVFEQRTFVPTPIVQDFLNAAEFERSELSDPNVATATWPGDGRVSIHFPRVAADGSEGVVTLLGNTTIPNRVKATRIRIPREAQLKVTAGTRITAQQNIQFQGTLKIIKDGDAGIAADLDLGIPSGIDLLIAVGGDLEIGGTIQGAGSVMLAAGGSVKITKDARLKCKNLRIVAPAGVVIDGDIPAEREVIRTPLPDARELWLRDNLTYRATSQWQRASGSLVTFGSPNWMGDAGNSRIQTYFRSARALPNAPNTIDPSTVSPWVSNPEELPPGEKLQFRIDFELPGTSAEKPLRLPFVDRIVIPTRRI